MRQWEREEFRSTDDGVRSAIDRIEQDYDREVSELGDIDRSLRAMKIHASSPNDLVRVTVDAGGRITDITVSDSAFRRSTPKQLTAEPNATIHSAIGAAAEAHAKIVAPLRSIVDALPDLRDAVPSAPDTRERHARFSQREPVRHRPD